MEQVLRPHFGDLIAFIQRTEPQLAAAGGGGAAGADTEFGNVTVLIRNFNAGWKASLDKVNGEVLGSFPNFRNGTNILQQALTLFVQYYHRFHQILGHAAFQAHPERAALINVHQLMVEVKKYKPSF